MERQFEQRFEVRKQELLEESQVSPSVFAGMMNRLREFAQPFVQGLWRQEQSEHAQTYLEGMLSDLQRKNVESVAYRNEQDRRGLQRFIGASPWDHRPLLQELGRQVGVELGETDGVIVFDPSGVTKKGRNSVGVARQWLGRVGKVDNGQVAVYMGYVSRQDHAIVNERIYLPKEWNHDKERRKKCGVPKGLRSQTRHALALEMLKEQKELLPHSWIAGDDEMGRATQFRRDLRAQSERYLLAIPSNSAVRDLNSAPPVYAGRGRYPQAPFMRVAKWRETLSPESWTRVAVRDGEKGPLVVELVKTRVLARTERSTATEELLVVIRSKNEDGTPKHDYYLSNAEAETPLEELARVAKAEHRIEECIERGKSEAGLADYEVRTWQGWHHHQTLSLIAVWFLICEARRGKKMDTCDYSTTSSQWSGVAVA